MPYFSFSIKQNYFDQEDNEALFSIKNLLPNTAYFSKNTKLWKQLNKKKFLASLNFIKFEERIKVSSIGKKILFCLPPSIGLGDSIEYGIAFKAIFLSNKFTKIGIAFSGKYKIIFKKYFDLHNVYGDFLSDLEIKEYDTIFHVSLEVPELKNQKYTRSDIGKNLLKRINVNKYILKDKIFTKPISRISIFPISQSPIRSMNTRIIKKLINHYKESYTIDIILDRDSIISEHIDKDINSSKINKIYPGSLLELCDLIEKIEFGVFIDSGPLHLAKILNKRGVLVTTSVGSEVLLNDFNSIFVFKNNYKSAYCKSPCGLTNIFNYKNKIGCYQTLSINKKDLLKENLNSLQRGSLKEKYIDFMYNPVGCVKNIDLLNLISIMDRALDN